MNDHPLDQLKRELSSLGLSEEQEESLSKLMDKCYLAGRDKSPHYYNYQQMFELCTTQINVISALLNSPYTRHTDE